MMPDTFAEVRSTPLPWDTESERPFGRTTITTGMPITSRPVITPTRVTPIAGTTGWSRSSVTFGSTVRWVPSTWVFAATTSEVTARSVPDRSAFGHREERRAHFVGRAGRALDRE